MMITPTGITISFGGSRDGRPDQRPVVARIFGFARGAEEEPVHREMVVPAGQSVQEDLDAGIYCVQLTLPSGRILQRNVTIDEDSNETYQFFEDFAPGAGFSLQESAGRGAQDILAEAAAASGNTSSADYEKALTKAASLVESARSEDRGTRLGFGYEVEPDHDVKAPPAPQLASLTFHTGLDPRASATETPGPDGGEIVAPEQTSGDSAMWRIRVEQPEPPTRQNRRWARVELPDGRVELASLPLPWFSTATGNFAPAELMVDPSRMEGAATTVAVRAERLAGLLSYLDRGQSGAARPMLEELERDNVIEQTISDKMSNPLAACAAAYVGLAVYPPNEREQWDHWLANCMNRFPDIPDAAIVHARRLVLRPGRSEGNEAVAEALRRACKAGVPFFSAGIALLREMLALLSTDFPDLVPLAEDAGRLTSRADVSQVFTVLRYAPARTA